MDSNLFSSCERELADFTRFVADGAVPENDLPLAQALEDLLRDDTEVCLEESIPSTDTSAPMQAPGLSVIKDAYSTLSDEAEEEEEKEKEDDDDDNDDDDDYDDVDDMWIEEIMLRVMKEVKKEKNKKKMMMMKKKKMMMKKKKKKKEEEEEKRMKLVFCVMSSIHSYVKYLEYSILTDY